MSTTAQTSPPAAAFSISSETTCWVALALTQGLGPSRIRKLVQHYGTAERVFQASLTELEATGMQAVSAQSLATPIGASGLDMLSYDCIYRERLSVARGPRGSRAPLAGLFLIAPEDPWIRIRGTRLGSAWK